MKTKRYSRFIGLLLIVLTLVLTACGGGSATDTPEVVNTGGGEGGTTEQKDQASSGNEETVATEAPEATLTPEEQFPEVLVLHPEATDVQANPNSGTYVYIIPMMVQEAKDYLLEEMTALGWETLGNPTVMGHLATINMQMEKTRVTISMQDNERSQTTRVQMLVLEQ